MVFYNRRKYENDIQNYQRDAPRSFTIVFSPAY